MSAVQRALLASVLLACLGHGCAATDTRARSSARRAGGLTTGATETETPAPSSDAPARCPYGLAATRVGDDPVAQDVDAVAPEIRAAFPTAREISDVVRLRREDGLEVVAATLWEGDQSAEVGFSSRRGEGAFAPGIRVDPSPLLDGEPQLAWTGESDRFAVLWTRGHYPFHEDVHVAIAEPGRVVSSRRIASGVRPEGHTLTRAGEHLVAAYAASSTEARERRGVVALAMDRDGAVVRRTELLAGDGLWPIAAATDDGRAVGIVYRMDRGALGFAAVSADGRLHTAHRVIERHDDPAAGYRAMSIVYGNGLFWVGTIVGFHVSVIVAAPTEVRLLALDLEGHAVRSERVSGATDAALLSMTWDAARTSSRARYADRSGTHEVAVSCRATVPTPEERGEGPCDPHVARWARGRFDPMRGPFRAVAVERGWVVAYRRVLYDEGYAHQEPTVRVARVRRDGVVSWDVELGEGLLDTQLVADTRSVALTWTHDERAHVSVLDLATGAERGGFRLEHGAEETGNACIAPSGGGWLIAFTREGPSRVEWLSRDGRVELRAELRDRWNGCALAETAAGYALVFTAAPRISESNWIYTVGLDARGVPRGDPERIAGESFARAPLMVRDGRGALAVWTGPVWRELVTQRIGADGAAVGAMTEAARTYGMSGFGIGVRRDGPELFWASERTGIGTRRVCAP